MVVTVTWVFVKADHDRSYRLGYDNGYPKWRIMRIHQIDVEKPKGWFEGPWNSDLHISVGYANEGINEPHLHRTITEIYLVAAGSAVMRVERQEITLQKGEMVVIEPGEAHTFISNSPDYLHFVVHAPGVSGEAARMDKVLIDLERLGL